MHRMADSLELVTVKKALLENTDDDDIFWLKQFLKLAAAALLGIGMLIGCCLQRLWATAMAKKVKVTQGDAENEENDDEEEIGAATGPQQGAQRRRSLIGPQQPTIEAVQWPMKGTTATALEQGYLADELRGLCRANGVMVQGTKREMAQRLEAKFSKLRKDDAGANRL